jgi:hypothetical protein
MNQKNRKPKPANSSQERLQEIGKILSNGIYRLEAKERSKNSQILLDNKSFPSLHSVGSNHNQTSATL